MTSSDERPKVSVIILNYNRPQDTLSCAYSVIKSDYSNLEIIVVDNCSEFSSFVFLKKKIEALNVILIRTKSNVGYAGGNNVGMLHSTGKYILILNDDVIINSTLISGLVKLAEEDDSIGMIGPALYRYDSKELWSYSPEILKTGNEVLDVPLVAGAAVMIKQEVAKKVGLLNENYFMYQEDWDWCFRVREAGYRTVCAPRLRAWHNVGENYYAPYFAYFFHRNYFLFAARHCKTMGQAVYFLFRRLVWYGDKRNFPIIYPLQALMNGRLKAFKAYFQGMVAGVVFFLRVRLLT